MGKIISERLHSTRVVEGVTVEITHSIWNNGDSSYDVQIAEGTLLTSDESFDSLPSDEQIAALFPAWWVCGCGRRIAEDHADMITDHVRACDAVDGSGQQR